MAELMDTRRRRLMQASLAGMLIASLPRITWAQVPPQAMLAMAQLAITVLGLTRKSGNSIGALLQLQIQMLQAISAQLVVVQQGIAAILVELNSIQDRLGRLPGEVVDELARRQVGGLLATFAEIMAAYNADLAAGHGLIVAQDNANRELENEFLQPLRQARALAMITPGYINAPILAAALQCEVHAMILAAYRPERIAAAVEQYRAYFARVQASEVRPALVIARKERSEALAKVTAATESSFRWSCMVKRRYKLERGDFPPIMGRCPNGSELRRGYEILVGEYFHLVSTEPSLLGGIQNDLHELSSAGLLTPADFPQKIAKDPRSWAETVFFRGCEVKFETIRSDMNFSSNPRLVPQGTDFPWRMQKIKDCNQTGGADRHEEEMKALTDQSTTSSMSVVALVSIDVVCQAALDSMAAMVAA